MFCRGGIEGNGDKDEYREAEQRGASVADKWQRNTHHRNNAHSHTYIYTTVEKEYRGDAVAIDSTEGLELSIAHTHQP